MAVETRLSSPLSSVSGSSCVHSRPASSAHQHAQAQVIHEHDGDKRSREGCADHWANALEHSAPSAHGSARDGKVATTGVRAQANAPAAPADHQPPLSAHRDPPYSSALGGQASDYEQHGQGAGAPHKGQSPPLPPSSSGQHVSQPSSEHLYDVAPAARLAFERPSSSSASHGGARRSSAPPPPAVPSPSRSSLRAALLPHTSSLHTLVSPFALPPHPWFGSAQQAQRSPLESQESGVLAHRHPSLPLSAFLRSTPSKEHSSPGMPSWAMDAHHHHHGSSFDHTLAQEGHVPPKGEETSKIPAFPSSSSSAAATVAIAPPIYAQQHAAPLPPPHLSSAGMMRSPLSFSSSAPKMAMSALAGRPAVHPAYPFVPPPPPPSQHHAHVPLRHLPPPTEAASSSPPETYPQSDLPMLNAGLASDQDPARDQMSHDEAQVREYGMAQQHHVAVAKPSVR